MSESTTLQINSQVGAMFIPATVAHVMYGIICSQVTWYYRHYPRDNIGIKILVGLICLMETIQAALMVPTLWHFLINRGVDSSLEQLLQCLHWTFLLPLLPTEICCFLVECFFLLRMWRLTCSKYATTLAVIPFVVGWAFEMVYIAEKLSTNHKCLRMTQNIDRWFLVSYSLRFLSDGVMAGSLCYTLWKRRACASSRTNSLQMLRVLIVWTLSTGLFMWLSTITAIITYVVFGKSLLSVGVYFLRGRVYGHAILALLNHRERFREIADKSISLQPVDVFGTSTSKTNAFVNRTPDPQAA